MLGLGKVKEICSDVNPPPTLTSSLYPNALGEWAFCGDEQGAEFHILSIGHRDRKTSAKGHSCITRTLCSKLTVSL